MFAYLQTGSDSMQRNKKYVSCVKDRQISILHDITRNPWRQIRGETAPSLHSTLFVSRHAPLAEALGTQYI